MCTENSGVLMDLFYRTAEGEASAESQSFIPYWEDKQIRFFLEKKLAKWKIITTSHSIPLLKLQKYYIWIKFYLLRFS